MCSFDQVQYHSVHTLVHEYRNQNSTFGLYIGRWIEEWIWAEFIILKYPSISLQNFFPGGSLFILTQLWSQRYVLCGADVLLFFTVKMCVGKLIAPNGMFSWLSNSCQLVQMQWLGDWVLLLLSQQQGSAKTTAWGGLPCVTPLLKANLLFPVSVSRSFPWWTPSGWTSRSCCSSPSLLLVPTPPWPPGVAFPTWEWSATSSSGFWRSTARRRSGPRTSRGSTSTPWPTTSWSLWTATGATRQQRWQPGPGLPAPRPVPPTPSTPTRSSSKLLWSLSLPTQTHHPKSPSIQTSPWCTGTGKASPSTSPLCWCARSPSGPWGLGMPFQPRDCSILKCILSRKPGPSFFSSTARCLRPMDWDLKQWWYRNRTRVWCVFWV